MWISKDEYQRLCNERDDWRSQTRTINIDLIQALNDKINYKMLVDEQQNTIDELVKTINDIVNITFEDNKCFETVIFQRYGKAPKIYHKGKKITDTTGSEIAVTFKKGEADIKKTNRFTR